MLVAKKQSKNVSAHAGLLNNPEQAIQPFVRLYKSFVKPFIVPFLAYYTHFWTYLAKVLTMMLHLLYRIIKWYV
jgi:hypothetical protein